MDSGAGAGMAAGEVVSIEQDYRGRLARARVGLWIVLGAVGLLFAVLTIVYMARQGVLPLGEAEPHPVHGWGKVRLPSGLLAFNTLVLLISSFTMEALRRATRRAVALVQVKSIPGVSLGEEKTRPWLAATVGLGLLFLAGQLQA